MAQVGELLHIFATPRGSLPLFQQRVRDEKMSRPAAVARNIILLWYPSTWFPLPEDWYKEFDPEQSVLEEQVVSVGEYTEVLVWPAIGVNGLGSNPLGFTACKVSACVATLESHPCDSAAI